MLTIQKVRKFVRIRNKSEFDSNLSFIVDCMEAGFEYKELGQAKHLPHAQKIGDQYYQFYWDLPFGILVENFGRMRLFAKKGKKNSTGDKP